MTESLPSPAELAAARTKLNDLLRHGVSLGASDLHLRAGEPPYARINGKLQPLGDEPLGNDRDMNMILQALTERVRKRMSEFQEHGEADLSYSLEGAGRFRVNMYRQRGSISLTLRVIPDEVPNLADLVGVPPVIQQMANAERGLILVTGATGSGKTTTLAGIIDHINQTTAKHILTIEDPIEIMHKNKQSLISQREVGADTSDFAQALRRALRQDPDVILIGEIRDEETMRTALAAAETGHLVLATLHTIDVVETIARVLDLFPTDAEKQARAMLAGALVGVVSQRLIRSANGGRVAAVEVLVSTGRVVDCILNPEDTAKLADAVSQGEYYGMQSFDQALMYHVLAGRVTVEEAAQQATSRQNFKLMLEAQGVRGPEDVARIIAEAEAAAQRSAQEAAEAEAAQAAGAAVYAEQAAAAVDGASSEAVPAAPVSAYEPEAAAPPAVEAPVAVDAPVYAEAPAYTEAVAEPLVQLQTADPAAVPAPAPQHAEYAAAPVPTPVPAAPVAVPAPAPAAVAAPVAVPVPAAAAEPAAAAPPPPPQQPVEPPTPMSTAPISPPPPAAPEYAAAAAPAPVPGAVTAPPPIAVGAPVPVPVPVPSSPAAA